MFDSLKSVVVQWCIVKVKLRLLVPSPGIIEVAKVLIESVTACHDAQVLGPLWASNPLYLTVLIAKSEDYTLLPHNILKCPITCSQKSHLDLV